jgi:hypothetical protein
MNDTKTNIAEERRYRARYLGVNGADPTLEVGSAGFVVTRTGEGEYLATWSSNPGVFIGWVPPGFGAATPGDLKGYTAVRDTYDSSTFSIAFIVYNSSFSAADLIANQYMDLEFVFAESSVN